jgi:hypothetical protein
VSERIAVVTAIIGPVDDLHDPVPQSVPCDWFCYTDQRRTSRVWQVLDGTTAWQKGPSVAELQLRENNLRSKWFKWQHHVLPELAGYQRVVYIDGSLIIKDPFFVEHFCAAAGSGASLLIHPKRDCAYAEAAFCWGIPKYVDCRFDDQVAAYRAEGFPEHWGLWCAGVQCRPLDERHNAVWDSIWSEVLRWGKQDQVSLARALWKTGLRPASWEPEGGLYWSRYLAKANHLPGYQELGLK